MSLGSACLTVAQAQDGELVLGFTQSSGTDLICDLGNASTLAYGQRWNFGGQLASGSLNSHTVQWGVIGVSPNNRIWTTAGNTPVNGVSPVYNDQISALYSAVYNQIAPNFFTEDYINFGIGDNPTRISTDSPNSWNSQTVLAATPIGWSANGQEYVWADPSAWASIYPTSPNMTGTEKSSLYAVVPGEIPIQLGVFSLAADGVLSYSAVPIPETTSFAAVSGAGLLLLSLRYRISRPV